jgi:hypothetical protein
VTRRCASRRSVAASLSLGTVLPNGARGLNPGPSERLIAARAGCPVRGAFAPLSAASSSHRRQPLVMGADGDPRLPSAGCEPARGRRARPGLSTRSPGSPSRISGQDPVPGCSTSGPPHESAPREQARQPRRMVLTLSRIIFRADRRSEPNVAHVIAGLVPAISLMKALCLPNRDARDKPGHDAAGWNRLSPNPALNCKAARAAGGHGARDARLCPPYGNHL